MVTINTI